ncbi:histidine phosphatase family protein [Mycolicibacterium pulveris]|nr:histidine phosphatase family protein [Mycolicibacterium pulveris]
MVGTPTAHAQRTITLTLVRSAESASNAANVVDTSVPGPPLSPVGYEHAAAAASQLSANGYDGIYSANMTRSLLTAAPLAQLTGEPIHVLPGLRQIEAGIYEGHPEPESHEKDHTNAWLAGDLDDRIPGSISGAEFDARFDEAVQAIYDSGDVNPIAFTGSTAAMMWVLMNVSNPNDSLLVTDPLPNLGRIVVVGSPGSGWKLTNWDGIPIA